MIKKTSALVSTATVLAFTHPAIATVEMSQIDKVQQYKHMILKSIFSNIKLGNNGAQNQRVLENAIQKLHHNDIEVEDLLEFLTSDMSIVEANKFKDKISYYSEVNFDELTHIEMSKLLSELVSTQATGSHWDNTGECGVLPDLLLTAVGTVSLALGYYAFANEDESSLVGLGSIAVGVASLSMLGSCEEN